MTASQSRSLTIRVPATSANLGAGFDTIGVALDRHLWVTAMPRTAVAPRVVTTGEGAEVLADDDDNLIWASLVRFCGTHAVPVPDLQLQVHNDIPLERGLGSSSAAIVAGLALARAVTGVAVSDNELVVLATQAEGHPDNVGPAVLGGFVTAAVGSDGLVVRRAQPSPGLVLVVAVPSVRQNTHAARQFLPDGLDGPGVVSQLGRVSHVVGAMVGAWPPDAGMAGDLWHEPPRLAAMPLTAAIINAWREARIFGYLSGAGPTAAALVANTQADVDRAGSVATAAAAEFSGGQSWAPGQGPQTEVGPVAWDLAGARIDDRRPSVATAEREE